MRDLRAWLPRGDGLDGEAWRRRHHGVCVVLWLHVAGLALIGLARGQSPLHALADAAIVAWFAVGASVERLGPLLRSAVATAGLMASSAVLVHIFGGLIEVHFHFFVMVAIAALYQAWTPFLVALAFVFLHHGVAGSLAPHAVYNHPSAERHPILWGLVHAGFIFAESVACLVYWRASEETVRHEREARLAAQQAHRDLEDAQELSRVGSWELYRREGRVAWSAQMYALTGLDPEEHEPSVALFLEMVHPEDRERARRLVTEAGETGTDLDFETRLVRTDGSLRWVHCRGTVVLVEDGEVLRMRGTCHDITERKQLEEAIARLAFHDPLTGVPNRRLFVRRLEEELDRARACGGTCAVLFVDLDAFKQVNDTHGHAVGDLLLQEVARRLQAAVRSEDLVARLGGDEFAVLCVGADSSDAARCVDRIVALMAPPVLVEGRAVPLLASIGQSIASGTDSPTSVLRRADDAMYDDKARRTGSVVPASVPASVVPAGQEGRLTVPLSAEEPGATRESR